MQALERTRGKAVEACKYDARFQTIVLTDEPCAAHLHGFGARVVVTPNTFRPAKARYKARSLEYFRKAVDLQEGDWVLHLDEESAIDEHLLRACQAFIEEGCDDFGQVSSSGYVSFCRVMGVTFRSCER